MKNDAHDLNYNIKNSIDDFITFKDFKSYTVGPLSFSIKKGKVTAVLGGSGSGKTVILSSLMGIIRSFKGTISIDGIKRNSKNYWIPNKNFGFYTQMDFNLYNISAYNFLFDICLTMGIDKSLIKDRVNHWLKFFELYKERNKLLKNFSWGMKNRINFILCFINEPNIIVLDEPGANLDSIWRERIKKLLVKYKNEGKTIIFTVHNIDEMNDIIDRYIIVESGALIFSGTHQELDLYSKYKFVLDEHFDFDKFKTYCIERDIKIFKYNANDKTVVLSIPNKKAINWIFLFFIKEGVPIENIVKLTVNMESIHKALNNREILTQDYLGNTVKALIVEGKLVDSQTKEEVVRRAPKKSLFSHKKNKNTNKED